MQLMVWRVKIHYNLEHEVHSSYSSWESFTNKLKVYKLKVLQTQSLQTQSLSGGTTNACSAAKRTSCNEAMCFPGLSTSQLSCHEIAQHFAHTNPVRITFTDFGRLEGAEKDR